MSHAAAGKAVAYVHRTDPAQLTGAKARRFLAQARQRVQTLVARVDTLLGEVRRLRAELREARDENTRLMRLAHLYQQQAGMTPEKD